MTTKSKTKVELPDGNYNAHYGGYVVNILDRPYDSYQFETVDGVKTPRCVAIVVVANGVATVQTI